MTRKASTGAARPGPARYHHGDLRAALLQAARALLQTEGPDGLTLRAAARAAGVSHAAPQHHFGDLVGLLSDLAAIGFGEFADQLEAALRGLSGSARLEALGVAYVSFAAEQPQMFLLMFRSDRLDPERPALQQSMQRARAVLAGEAAAPAPDSGDSGQRGRILRAWSLAHGFAMLLIDGRLARSLSAIPGGDWRPLFEEVLSSNLG